MVYLLSLFSLRGLLSFTFVVKSDLLKTNIMKTFELNIQGVNGDNRAYTGSSKREATKSFKAKYPYKLANVKSKYWNTYDNQTNH